VKSESEQEETIFTAFAKLTMEEDPPSQSWINYATSV